MLKHRLISGTILASAAVGILYGDSFLAPYYPILLVFVMLLGILGTRELLALMRGAGRPRFGVTALSVVVVLLANWSHVVFPAIVSPWQPVSYAFAGSVMFAFLVEMYFFREPGNIVVRLSQTVLIVAYLGLLPSFFVQIRYLPSEHTALLLLLTIFVTKCGDIGAYAAGNLFGKRKFSPLLSPKKTWQGALGMLDK